ncbi:hypothetical protein BY996DRAFT_6511168 [Phakopsora pachyrhizi]|nr:hypothetical protein BY996DRAFT_6511168 [Phakopsora pachyrhizi]
MVGEREKKPFKNPGRLETTAFLERKKTAKKKNQLAPRHLRRRAGRITDSGRVEEGLSGKGANQIRNIYVYGSRAELMIDEVKDGANGTGGINLDIDLGAQKKTSKNIYRVKRE